MNRAVQRYLERRTRFEAWPLLDPPKDTPELVVVIPACQEAPNLFMTLGDLKKNDSSLLEKTLVIVVVNHRVDAPEAVHENNLATLATLEDWRGKLPLAVVDAASPGKELPTGEGVGLARKLGLDHGLALLAQGDDLDRPLVCLDADTRVQANYLEALDRFFETSKRWAALVDYAHPLDGPQAERAAILAYEIFLRCHALGLRRAQSPYAFTAIGSAMACTGAAYAAVSGMNRRLAGEDFYFLQQLAKTGPVEAVEGTTVFPSARGSDRVPFGTGARVRQYLDEGRNAYLTYHPDSYEILRAWLEAVERHLAASSEILLEHAQKIAPALAEFLVRQKFAKAWEPLRKTHGGTPRMFPQFHVWFDGFRTLKLLHYLRDHGYPEQPLLETAAGLLQCIAPKEDDLEGQARFLQMMRR
jgi:hypothetical protein